MKRTAFSIRVAAALLLIGATLATPATSDAQLRIDSLLEVTTFRAASPFETEVELLSRLLLRRRNELQQLSSSRSILEASLRNAQVSESQQSMLASRLRSVTAQLAAIESERDRIQAKLSSLCSPEQQPEGWMGVTFSAEYIRTPESTRFTAFHGVESVEPGSPAERAGIQRGDRLLSIGGRELQDGEFNFIELLKPGNRLPVRLLRGVETRNVSVLIEPRPSDFRVPCTWIDDATSAAFAPQRPNVMIFRMRTDEGMSEEQTRLIVRRDDAPRAFRTDVLGVQPVATPGVFSWSFTNSAAGEWLLGAQLATLNGDLGKALGADRGVLVVDVAPRSQAALSGLRGGDVIISANGVPLTSPSGLLRFTDELSREIKLRVVRNRKIESLDLRW
jgi:hypothetical protein